MRVGQYFVDDEHGGGCGSLLFCGFDKPPTNADRNILLRLTQREGLVFHAVVSSNQPQEWNTLFEEVGFTPIYEGLNSAHNYLSSITFWFKPGGK